MTSLRLSALIPFLLSASDYHYNSFSQMDPFSPTQGEVLSQEEPTDQNPLKKFPLDKLQLVGIWTLSSGERKALIMTEQGEGLIVKAGDALGQRDGHVLEIEENRMKVREFNLALDGTKYYEDLFLQLGSKQSSSS